MISPIRAIHQIELTSRCNLACSYCVHPTMVRPKMDMDEETFDRALALAYRCVSAYGQRELNLAGIGESTLHPRFVEWVLRARRVVGPGVRLVLATNGIEINEAMASAIAPANPDIWVSQHRPEKAISAARILRRHGMLRGESWDPSESSVDWAGQVEYHVSAPRTPCPWIPNGRVIVLSDGRLSTCCFDSDGSGVVGTVWDDIDALAVQPYGLCKTCHQTLPGH